MSIAIDQLAAELRKLSPDEWERVTEHWNASQEHDAASMQAPDGGIAEQPGEIERGAA